jgi:hypothetical protein
LAYPNVSAQDFKDKMQAETVKMVQAMMDE